MYSPFYMQHVLQSPELAARLGFQIPGAELGSANIPLPPSMPIQRPQLGQLPQFLPATPGFNPMAGPSGTAPGNMPFIRNAAMSQVLGPLMQQNYGLPTISPFGQQSSRPGIGQPIPGLNIPGRVGIGDSIPRVFAW
jgi:hypothetical protein